MQIQELILNNFMSHEYSSLKLESRGLVLVEGENKDSGGSNGAGKSSLFDAITWCLFGETNRKIKADDVCRLGSIDTCVYCKLRINSLLVEIYRYRNHSANGNKIVLFIDGVDRSMGSNRETQSRIDELLQINYETFNSVAVFPQGMIGFASLSDSAQKAIMEKILGFERFTAAQERAKEKAKIFTARLEHLKGQLKMLDQLLSKAKSSLQNFEDLQAKFESNKSLTIKKLEEELDSLSKSTVLPPKWLYERIEELTNVLRSPELEDLKAQHKGLSAGVVKLCGNIERIQYSISLDEARIDPNLTPPEEERPESPQVLQIKLQAAQREHLSLERDMEHRSRHLKQLREKVLKGLQTTLCPTCAEPLTEQGKKRMFGAWQEEIESEDAKLSKDRLEYDDLEETIRTLQNALDHSRHCEAWTAQLELKESIKKLELLKDSGMAQLAEVQQKLSNVNDSLSFARELEAELSNLTLQLKLQEQEYKHWKENFARKEAELERAKAMTSDYPMLIAKEEENLNALTNKLQSSMYLADRINLEKEYLEFWVQGFGAKGVKSLLLDTVLEFLNLRAGEYFDSLTDGQGKIQFRAQTPLADGSLRDTFGVSISLSRGADCYAAVSGGERRRADIACMLALGDLAASRSPAQIQLRLLDEVFESLDTIGQESVVNLLNEKVLPRSKTILVMTHEENMKSLFDNRIVVTKKNGVSKVEEC